jgi:hypothetical protein
MTQASSMSADACEVTAPNFFLQRKLGGPAGRVLNPINVKRAQTAMEGAMPAIEAEIDRLLRELHLAVEAGAIGGKVQISQIAHQIAGLATTASKRFLAQAADIICRYLDGTQTAFQPDKAVLSTIATVAMLAMRTGADADPMVEKLIGDGVRAVDAQRRREGRGPA